MGVQDRLQRTTLLHSAKVLPYFLFRTSAIFGREIMHVHLEFAMPFTKLGVDGVFEHEHEHEHEYEDEDKQSREKTSTTQVLVGPLLYRARDSHPLSK